MPMQHPSHEFDAAAFPYQTGNSSLRLQVVDFLLVHVAPPVAAVGRCVLEWERRRRSRQALRSLDHEEIRDFCLDPMEAEREASKPFWRA
jgi:uncharacterized protein YjiS (DUF1127 family)